MNDRPFPIVALVSGTPIGRVTREGVEGRVLLFAHHRARARFAAARDRLMSRGFDVWREGRGVAGAAARGPLKLAALSRAFLPGRRYD